MNDKFNIVSHEFDQPEIPTQLESRQWDLAIVGNPDSDERSVVARDYAVAHSKNNLLLRYENNTIYVNNELVTRGRLQTLVESAKSVLIEATALACPELLILLKALTTRGIREISFLYLAPLEYRRNLKGNLSEHRDFDLSVNCRYKSVHGFMTDLTDTPVGQAIFFLGFEKSRLGQAFEQEETLREWQKYAVFGVPGYEPGWENDALANNVHHLAANSFEVRYVAAASAASSYKLLNDLRKADKTARPIVICPLGTKPHTIGAALFLIEHNEGQEATLLYDHPNKSTGRSSEVRRWHLYDVTW